MVSFSLIFCILIMTSFFSVVNLDDCWQYSRDAQGTIQADPNTFPSGIPALADYIHSKKLKFGLYSGTEQILFMYSFVQSCLFPSIY
jgi:hypothetical protein